MTKVTHCKAIKNMERDAFPGQYLCQLMIIQILIHDVANYPLKAAAHDRLLIPAPGIAKYVQYLMGPTGFPQHNEATTRAAGCLRCVSLCD